MLSRILSERLANTTFGDLPAAVIAEARRAVLDWLGSALAGSIEPPARSVQAVVRGFGASDEASVFSAGRSSAAGAALANGVASHILELDDVHKRSTLHPAAAIIPAALAVAERERASGAAFLLAVVVGYEAALRIGEAVNPSHYRFWHPTGTAATFGAAVAAGSLLRLNPAQMLDALGSAGTQAAGLWEFNADGTMSKHLHPGKAAFNGILSADLASRGFTGAATILEGERGFFRAMSASFDPSRITDGLGERWKILENCYKLHSCCGHTHTAIDAALAIRREVGSEPVREVHVDTYGPGYQIVREPNPRTVYQAKFSLAYVTAVALKEGAVGLAQFEPLRDVGRVHIRVDDSLTALYPQAWPARVRVILQDGRVIEKALDYPRGHPENPMTTEELETKFRALVGPRLGSLVVQSALDFVRRVAEMDVVSVDLNDG